MTQGHSRTQENAKAASHTSCTLRGRPRGRPILPPHLSTVGSAPFKVPKSSSSTPPGTGKRGLVGVRGLSWGKFKKQNHQHWLAAKKIQQRWEGAYLDSVDCRERKVHRPRSRCYTNGIRNVARVANHPRTLEFSGDQSGGELPKTNDGSRDAKSPRPPKLPAPETAESDGGEANGVREVLARSEDDCSSTAELPRPGIGTYK